MEKIIRLKKEIIKKDEVIKEEVIECKVWKDIRAYAKDRKDFI